MPQIAPTTLFKDALASIGYLTPLVSRLRPNQTVEDNVLSRLTVLPLYTGVLEHIEDKLTKGLASGNIDENPCYSDVNIIPEEPDLENQIARRRLLGASSSCASSTSNSVSTSSSISYSVATSTSGDSAIIDGDGDMFLLFVQSIRVTLSTILQASECTIHPPFDSPSAELDPNSQTLWVSQHEIKHRILVDSDNLLTDMRTLNANSTIFSNPSEQTIYNLTVVNRANWQKMIDLNEHLKATALPWPTLLRAITFNNTKRIHDNSEELVEYPVKEVNNDVVISFGGAMGGFAFGINQDVAATRGSQVSKNFGRGKDWSIGGGVSVIGVGLHEGYTEAKSADNSGSQSFSSAETTGSSVSFNLDDPDLGDTFDVMIRRDPWYNTPVFITLSGKSRCRYEQNTLMRESLIMNMNPSTLMNIPHDSVATSVLEITNESPTKETFSYYLNQEMEDNENGLILTANGIELLHNAVYLTLKPGVTQVLIGIKRAIGSRYSFDSIRLKLTGVCYEHIVSATEYSFNAVTAFSVSFTQPCSRAEFASSHSDRFIINNKSSNTIGNIHGAYHTVVIYNPELHIADRSWRAQKYVGRLSNIFIEMKPHDAINDNNWVPAPIIDGDFSSVEFNPFDVSNDVYAFLLDLRSISGVYDFRVRCECRDLTEIQSIVDTPLVSYSRVITGYIDRHPPILLAPPEPYIPEQGSTPNSAAFPLYYPGSPIRAKFNEPILCRTTNSYLTYTSWTSIYANELVTFSSPNAIHLEMVWYCHDNVLDMSFKNPNWINLINKNVVIQVTGISDVVGNRIEDATNDRLTYISWMFKVAAFDTANTLVQIDNVVLLNGASAIKEAAASLPSSRRLLDATSTETTPPKITTTSSDSQSSPQAPLHLYHVDNLSFSSSSQNASNSSMVTVNIDWLHEQLQIEIISIIDLALSSRNRLPSNISTTQIQIRSLTLGTLSVGFDISPCILSTMPTDLSCKDVMHPTEAAHYFFDFFSNAGSKSLDQSIFPLFSGHDIWQLHDLTQTNFQSSISITIKPSMC